MKKILLLTKIFSIIIIILSFYVYAFITPKFNINTSKSITYYDKYGNDLFKERDKNDYVELNNISDYVKNSIVSIEDKNFYNHKGFDYLRIAKAMLVNLKSKKLKEGASTISQQYVKNLYLTFNKTWERKIQEALLTLELETHYSKNEILEGYLNTIDFGAGNYGIKEASKYYFNKEPKDLSLAEASIIVGIPKNPSYYNPVTNYKNAKKRQKNVLISMVKNKYISKDEMNKAFNEPLNFYAKNDKVELSSIYYYRDAVLKELSNIKEIPSSLLDMESLKIYTNLDKDVQKKLENNIDKEMKNSSLQVASVVITPSNGKIVALIGGKDYSKSQYNRAYSSKRQVGSTIKPFLYYSALENGFTASSTFTSEETTFVFGQNELYSPHNYGNLYGNKEITMAAAIAYSDNIYAVKTHLFLGENTLVNTLERVGIQSEAKSVPSLALGSIEINMLEMMEGYGTLANLGYKIKPYFIEKIEDTPDTVITLASGKMYIVQESRQDVTNLVLLYKKEIFSKN